MGIPRIYHPLKYNFSFIICLHLEFETLQTFGVAKVQVFWDIRGIQVFWTRLQQILRPGGSSGCSSLVTVSVKVPEVAGGPWPRGLVDFPILLTS